MQPNTSNHLLMETPVWAARTLQVVFMFALVFGVALAFPSWRCQAARPFLGAFGLLCVLFGLFTLSFSWRLPRRYGGGFYARSSNPVLWKLFCVAFVAMGTFCLLASSGLILFRTNGCA